MDEKLTEKGYVEPTHSSENIAESWRGMLVSDEARVRLEKIGSKSSGWIDQVVHANPELYPDDTSAGVFPRITQDKRYHEHDILTHTTVAEESVRSGEVAAVTEKHGVSNLKLKDWLRVKQKGSELTRYELVLVSIRLHDMGKFFEPKRPHDKSKNFKKQDTSQEKVSIKNSPFKHDTHFEIGQEIVGKLASNELNRSEVDFISKSLSVHNEVQRLLRENNGGSISGFDPEQLGKGDEHKIAGLFVAIADELAKGAPSLARTDFDKRRNLRNRYSAEAISKLLDSPTN